MGEGVNPSTSALTTGPGTTDLLFPRQGQRLAVLGDLGEAYLVQGPGGLATAFKSVLKLLPAGTPPPAAGAGSAAAVQHAGRMAGAAADQPAHARSASTKAEQATRRA